MDFLSTFWECSRIFSFVPFIGSNWRRICGDRTCEYCICNRFIVNKNFLFSFRLEINFCFPFISRGKGYCLFPNWLTLPSLPGFSKKANFLCFFLHFLLFCFIKHNYFCFYKGRKRDFVFAIKKCQVTIYFDFYEKSQYWQNR